MPDKTECSLGKDHIVTAKGPMGQATLELNKGVTIEIEDKKIYLKQINPKLSKAMVGLNWALIRNLVEGVSKGFEKHLMLIGVGYRAAVSGKNLDLKVGHSHPVALPIPEGIKVKVDKSVDIFVSGINKQAVGQFTAEIRAIRKPEPYKGKGIRYKDEHVRKKAGKAAKAGAAK